MGQRPGRAGRLRHVAHLGRAVRLDDLLLAPPQGLLEQARAGGLVDGCGVGWYPPPEFGRPGTTPVRYRRAAALGSDGALSTLAGSVASGCVLAAVRAAPDGAPADESACPPFLLGDVLLSCDGEASGLPAALGRLVTGSALAAVGSTVPGAFVAALVAARLAAGDALPAALRAAAALVVDRLPEARLALLATDGRSLAGLCRGGSLVWRAGDGAVVVASEPCDDGPGWTPVADASLLTATLDGVDVTPL